MTKAIKAKKAWCLNTAEYLEKKFSLANLPRWDVDECAKIIEMLLPLTHSEAIEEYEKLRSAETNLQPEPTSDKPSVFSELREVLGITDGNSLSVLRAALQKLRENKAVEQGATR